MSRAIGEFVETIKASPNSLAEKDLFNIHVNDAKKSTIQSYPHAIYCMPRGMRVPHGELTTYPDWCADSYGPRFHRPSRPQQLWIKAFWMNAFYRKVKHW